MYDKDEKRLISIIRYAPIIFIILLSIPITYFVQEAYKSQLQEEIQRITKFYSDFNNKEIKEEVDRVHEYIKTQDKNSIKELKKELKKRVYQAHDIASKIYKENKHTKSEKEILMLIKSALGSIVFNNGRGYYFIFDIKGFNLLQPLNRKLENTNLLDFENTMGYELIRRVVQSIKDKTESFDSYYWIKNAEDTFLTKKTSFYKTFEPLNISIGAGEYIDDYEKELKTSVINHIQNIKLKNGEYIFLIDYDGKVLAHKNTDNIGKNLINSKDKNNLEFIKEIIKFAKLGGDFFSYYNPTTKSVTYKKTSYVNGYDKWQWSFGTGYSEEKLLEIISNVQKKLLFDAKEGYKKIIIANVIITISLLIITFVLSKFLENILIKYKEKIKKESSELKITNDKLKSKKNELETIIQDAPNPIILHQENGNILMLNHAWIDSTGFSLEEVSTTTDLINSVYDDEESKVFTKERVNTLYKITKKTKESEVTFLNKNRDLLTWQFISAPLGLINGKRTVISSAMDITELKKKDEMLINQSRHAAMGEMIGMIAHQWRQPLSAIIMDANNMLIDIELGDFSLSESKEFASSICNQTEELSKTIDDFSNFFKPDKDIVNVNIEEVLDKTISMVKSSLKSNNIKLEISNETNTVIKAYPRELMQVFINIINNAKDVFEHNKSNNALISIKVYEDKTHVITEIYDNGGGIDAEILPQVFDPYFSTKDEKDGTGIGLYMSKMIIENHLNGLIEVKNVNNGACFIVRLLK